MCLLLGALAFLECRLFYFVLQFSLDLGSASSTLASGIGALIAVLTTAYSPFHDTCPLVDLAFLTNLQSACSSHSYMQPY